MKVELPKPIAKYFAADRGDAHAVAECFTENAVVVDENHTYSGRPAIRRWKESATTRYKYTSKPVAAEEQSGKTVVTSRLTGDFPGSPVELRYVFELTGDKIAFLEITPSPSISGSPGSGRS
jgi:ketosteroid isomerase-like protein